MGIILLLGACGGDKSDSEQSEIFDDRASSSGTGPGSASESLLEAPSGTDETTIATAADIVRARLVRMGITDATVTAQADGVSVRSSADPYQLRAAAQLHATTVAPVASTALGPCDGTGTASTGAAARCYVLGPALTGVASVTNATVQSASGTGWKVTFSIDPNHYKTFRAALAAGGAGSLALVADGAVVLEFGSGVPALDSAIGPPLAEDQARQAARPSRSTPTFPSPSNRPCCPRHRAPE